MKTKKDNSYKIIQQIKKNNSLAEKLDITSDILFNLYLNNPTSDLMNELYNMSKDIDRIITNLSDNSKKLYLQIHE